MVLNVFLTKQLQADSLLMKSNYRPIRYNNG